MLRPLSGDGARQVREFFAAADYTDRHFRQTPALRELPHWFSDLSRLLETTREPSGWHALLRWFILGVPQEVAAVAAWAPHNVLQSMIECGMLLAEGSRLSPTVIVVPAEGGIFAGDAAARVRTGPEDLVLWPSPTANMLLKFAVRRPSRATLDFGTGCGILAILASAYSTRVVATDLNPRAEEFVRLNESLNGVSDIECLTGDTFAPVAGRTFDRILANLPFYITPTSGQMYCENPMELDQFARRVVREAAGHLTEGGFFQAILEWVEVKGQPWQERLAEWLEGAGCDAWIARSYSLDLPGYAEKRIQASFPGEPVAARFAEWMDYYRSRQVEQVHGGLIALRRRSGQNWLRIEEIAPDAGEPFGDDVLAAFAIQDALSAHPSDEQLASLRPRLSRNVQLEQVARFADRKWQVSARRLRLLSGLPASLNVEGSVSEFLAQCDGTRTLGELVETISASVGVPAAEVGRQCCSMVRRLAERRFLEFLSE